MQKLSHKNEIYLHSDALKSINYDAQLKILEATFTNNRVYQYQQVPVTIWKEFLKVIESGESAGAFINQNIKPEYDFIELTF